MKKILIMSIFTGMVGMLQSQTFKWEKLDSTNKTKSQLYSDTKMFIAETWKSAQNVIQDDDKEGGMILVKGISNSCESYRFGGHFEYTFSYSVKFLFKDRKWKIVVDQVNCNRGYWIAGTRPTEMICHSVYTPLDRYGLTDIREKDWTIITHTLETELQSIVDKYSKKIKENSATAEW